MQYIDGKGKKTNMYETIADKLEEMILTDAISIDEKLPSEQTLATSFGVSRPVIREALMLLNARGLISQKNGEGNYVSQPTSENFNRTMNLVVQLSSICLHSLFEVRLVLEVLSSQLAATHATMEDIEALEKINQEMIDSGDDNVNRANIDARFHAKIAAMGGNKIVELFINSLTAQIATMIEQNLVISGSHEDAEHYHAKVIEAIKSHSPDRTADIMRSHIIMSMRNSEYVKKHK